MTISSYLLDLQQQETQRLNQVQKDVLPHFHYEYSDLPERLRNILPGRARFIAYTDCLYKMYDAGIRLTALQTRLMNGMKMAACQRIFQDELLYNYDFLATQGIMEIITCMYTLFPRRGGKSTTQQVSVGAQMLTQPDGKYIALSLYARQGYDWLDSLKMYVSQLKDDEQFGYTVEADNREVLTIIPRSVGTINSTHVYPGGAGGMMACIYNNIYVSYYSI